MDLTKWLKQRYDFEQSKNVWIAQIHARRGFDFYAQIPQHARSCTACMLLRRLQHESQRGWLNDRRRHSERPN